MPHSFKKRIIPDRSEQARIGQVFNGDDRLKAANDRHISLTSARSWTLRLNYAYPANNLQEYTWFY